MTAANDAPGPETREADPYVDSDHPSIVAFARAHAGPDDRTSAVNLYYAVRDGIRYNPWKVRKTPQDYKASAVLARGPSEGGHCIDKALLLAAGARALGIPSRLHFANVRNHIGTARLEKKLGTDLLVFHGYAELHLGGRWTAATPAFNRELCERLGVAPLEWDGAHDSIFQAYTPSGRFMEYVHDYGPFALLPFDTMVGEWRKYYGTWPDEPLESGEAGTEA